MMEIEYVPTENTAYPIKDNTNKLILKFANGKELWIWEGIDKNKGKLHVATRRDADEGEEEIMRVDIKEVIPTSRLTEAMTIDVEETDYEEG